MTWHTVDLSELIAKIESGGRPHGGASVDSGEIPSLGGENICLSGGLELDQIKKVPSSFFDHMTKGILKDKDVLINKDGANTGKVGFFENQFPKAAINEHVFLLRGHPEKIEQRYLYYLLLSQYCQRIIQSKISGSAQPGLKRDFISNFPLLLPKSIKEQLKISDVLVVIDNIISLDEKIIFKYQHIMRGLIHFLFIYGIGEDGQLRNPNTYKFKPTPLGRAPEKWQIDQFKVLAVCIDPQPDHRAPAEVQNGEPYIGVGDFLPNGNIDFINCRKVSKLAIDKQQLSFQIRDGDIIFGKIGTIGLPRRLKAGRYGLSANTILIKPKMIPDFSYWLLNSVHVNNQVRSQIHSTSQPAFGIKKIRALIVPIPQESEQTQIATILNFVEEIITTRKTHLQKLYLLREGLMHDLLAGNVSVIPFLQDQER